MKSCIWLSIAAVLCWAMPGAARAAEQVAVLGVRSLDGDSELERRLSTALRAAAAGVAGFEVSERDFALAQLTLAHGCDDPDARCLREIAQTLQAERLLYGTVVEGEAGGLDLTLYAFTQADGIQSATAPKVEPQVLKGSGATGAISALLKRLTGESDTNSGRLRILGKKPGTEIFVDGTASGVLDERGMLVVEVKPGKHFVLATGGPGEPEEQMALVAGGATVDVTLVQAPSAPSPSEVAATQVTESEVPSVEVERKPRSLRRIFGYGAIALGGAFAVATLYSWIRIGRINDDKDYRAYRASFPRQGSEGGVSDVCREAKRGTLARLDEDDAALENKARDLCDEGARLETLQYVFLGGAVVAGGVGGYLLWSAKKREKSQLTLTPAVRGRTALVEAQLSF